MSEGPIDDPTGQQRTSMIRTRIVPPEELHVLVTPQLLLWFIAISQPSRDASEASRKIQLVNFQAAWKELDERFPPNIVFGGRSRDPNLSRDLFNQFFTQAPYKATNPLEVALAALDSSEAGMCAYDAVRNNESLEGALADIAIWRNDRVIRQGQPDEPTFRRLFELVLAEWNRAHP